MKVYVGWNVFLLLTLIGCADTYPPLYISCTDSTTTTGVAAQSNSLTAQLTPACDDVSPPDIEKLDTKARKLQAHYAEAYGRTAQTTDLLNVPLVGAAGAGAGGLLFDAGKDFLKGVALGAGSYAAGRSVLYPSGLSDLYLTGYQATSCYLEQIGLFRNADADKIASIAKDIEVLDNSIVNNQARLALRLSAGASEAQKQAFQSALIGLAAAITEATQAIGQSRQELAAHADAARRFEAILASIQARVAAEARSGRAVDFATVRAGISKYATDISTNGGNGNEAALLLEVGMDDDEKIALLLISAAELRQRVQQLSTATPGFIDAIQKANNCPNIVT